MAKDLAATSIRKTDTKPSASAGEAVQTAAEAPDVSTLSVDALGASHSELDHTWDAEEFAGDLGAMAISDFFVLADPDENDEVVDIGLRDSSDNTSDATDNGGTIAIPPPVQVLNIINGGNGRDTLQGTKDADEIHGFGDTDLVFGSQGNDEIYGGGGADFLFGGAGRDLIFGGRDRDFIYGGRDHDRLFGGDDDDQLHGENGIDVLTGGNGHDELYGGNGGDLLFNDVGNDKLYGGSGDDTLTVVGLGAGDDNDLFDGGDGIDTLSFVGSSGPVRLALWDTNPQLAVRGMDTFIDIENVVGSRFDDRIAGTVGDNRLEGGRGEDTIDGGSGNDYLDGGADNDRLSGGTGNDAFVGGSGFDTANFSGAANGVVVNLSSTGPQNTGEGIDSFDSIEGVLGSTLSDFLYGNEDDNALVGREGNDWLWGAGGNDILFGDDDNDVGLVGGTDVLIGGEGHDFYVGGPGADAFVFTAQVDDGHNYIADFEDGVDKVFVEIGFGVTDFSGLTIESNADGNAVAHFTGGMFDSSITFEDVTAAQITADDFVFFT